MNCPFSAVNRRHYARLRPSRPAIKAVAVAILNPRYLGQIARVNCNTVLCRLADEKILHNRRRAGYNNLMIERQIERCNMIVAGWGNLTRIIASHHESVARL